MFVILPFDEGDELIPADMEEAGGREEGRQHLPRVDDQAAAIAVPILVIRGLKAIDVHHHDGEGLFRPFFDVPIDLLGQ